ncbi:MAG: hypothetical protein QM537_09245 [Candidatus Symbiobacter sp.]|nr:hypothetical protein [Candidatus Symbiobacter sp.]
MHKQDWNRLGLGLGLGLRASALARRPRTCGWFSAAWLAGMILVTAPTPGLMAQNKPPIVTAPSQLQPIIAKFKGKDALRIDLNAFPGNKYSFSTTPLPDLPASITVARITCNNDVSSIEFDPHEAFQATLDGCLAGKMPKVTLK